MPTAVKPGLTLTKPISDLTMDDAMRLYGFVKRTGNAIQGLDDPEDLLLIAQGSRSVVEASAKVEARLVDRRMVKCEICGILFMPGRSDAKYCSSGCRAKSARKRNG